MLAGQAALHAPGQEDSPMVAEHGSQEPMQVEAAGSAAAAAAGPVADADAMSDDQSPNDRGTKRTAESGGDDVARMEDFSLVARSINADLSKFGCNPIVLAQLEADEASVSEVFGRGKVLERAREFGLTPGFALDLGAGWDLNDHTQRAEAARLQERDRPLLLIGSPRCTAWTSLLNFRQAKQETIDNLMSEAICHMDVCVKMYNKQLEGGRYFFHEAPHTARSGHIAGIRDLPVRRDVFYVVNDQCEAGQTVPVKQLDGSMSVMTVQGRTGWITNSILIAKELSRFQCRNRHGGHRDHVHLVDGEAKHKANFPPALVASILRGFTAQVEYHKTVNGMGISAVGLDVGYNVDTETRELLHFPEYESTCDDVTGVQLPPEKVNLARKKEIEFQLEVPVDKCVDDAEA